MHEAAAFGFEHLPDRLGRLFRMVMRLGIGNTFVEQSDIQLFQTFYSQARREEALAHAVNLAFDLSLLPVGCWRTDYGLDKIVAAHLQEPPVIDTLLADKYGLDRRLYIVVDATRAGATEEFEGLVMRIEDHLQALTHIGVREHHPAVAEPDMGNLHRRRYALDQYDLVAPVELIGFARRILEWYVGFGCHCTLSFRPSLA